MEIFGSATQNHSEFMRHSVHTYNLSHHSSEQQHHFHHQQQHHQTVSMTSGSSSNSITHSQTMRYKISVILQPNIFHFFSSQSVPLPHRAASGVATQFTLFERETAGITAEAPTHQQQNPEHHLHATS